MRYSIEIFNNYTQRPSYFLSFDCGYEIFNRYLTNLELSHSEVLHVFIDDNLNKVIGYFSLLASSIVINKNYAPAAEIYMLAIDKLMQKNMIDVNYTFGQYILDKAIEVITNFSEIIGIRYIVVYSVPEVVSFYEKAGFLKFEHVMERKQDRFVDGCVPMYLDLER